MSSATPLPDEVAEVIAAEALAAWFNDPVQFCRDVFGVEPDEWQREVLMAAATEDRIAMLASKGPGKTFVLAVIVYWWMTTRHPAKVVCTSIDEDNLYDCLWAELRFWRAGSEMLQQMFDLTDAGLKLRRQEGQDGDDVSFASPRTWPKSGSQSDQANTLAGIHGPHVLFVIDEVGDIPDAVLAAAEGGLANRDAEKGIEAKIVMAGNPTRTSGPLWRAATEHRRKWFVYSISGDPDDPKRAPRVSIEWAREQIEMYGYDSDIVRINVRGLFPRAQSNAVCGIEIVQQAALRTLKAAAWKYHPRVLGVDCARFGPDRSVIFPRQGPIAFRPQVFRHLRATELADRIGEVIIRWKPHAVFVDAGNTGGATVDILLERGFSVEAVDFGGKPTDKFVLNMRAQMWFRMAEWLRTGAIPNDRELIAELVAPTYKYKNENRRCLESKEELAKRGVASPDLADGLACTFAAEVPMPDALDLEREEFDEPETEPAPPMHRGRRSDWDYDPYDEVHR